MATVMRFRVAPTALLRQPLGPLIQRCNLEGSLTKLNTVRRTIHGYIRVISLFVLFAGGKWRSGLMTAIQRSLD